MRNFMHNWHEKHLSCSRNPGSFLEVLFIFYFLKWCLPIASQTLHAFIGFCSQRYRRNIMKILSKIRTQRVRSLINSPSSFHTLRHFLAIFHCHTSCRFWSSRNKQEEWQYSKKNTCVPLVHSPPPDKLFVLLATYFQLWEDGGKQRFYEFTK